LTCLVVCACIDATLGKQLRDSKVLQ
jgi:hypothetical protein